MSNLVGTGLNQVPTNGMLGGLAYQDPNHASIKDLDLKNLSQINSEIANTAVDIFVYDTRKDSDGGAWRKRTQNTSWYNETLGTAIRGTRKEFPAVAVIVAESNKLTIYDGDDPDLPMWMVFTSVAGKYGAIYDGRTIKSPVAKNGEISLADSLDSVVHFNFIADTIKSTSNSGSWNSQRNLADRNPSDTNNYWTNYSSGRSIVAYPLNDVAMTVLPNAPVDSATGLPIPTIAVATAAGVTVIKDDGTVVDFTPTYAVNNQYGLIDFLKDNRIISTSRDKTYPTVFSIPSSDTSSFTSDHIIFSPNTTDSSSGVDIHSKNFTPFTDITNYGENIAMGGNGLRIANIDEVSGDDTALVADIRSDYNTGYMPGAIKGAFLSDTDTTNLVATDLDIVTNGNFAADSDWTKGTGWTISGGTATHTGSGGDFNQQIAVVLGKRYLMTVTVDLTGDTSIENTTLGFRTLANDGYYVSKSSWTANAVNSVGLYWTSTVTGNILVRCFSSDDVSLDNWVVQDVTDGNSDRSVNAKGLQVFGTVTKSAVATGAELVAYSGWSTSNYLEQPYNSDLNFGTGDFYVMGWAKPTNNTAGYVWEIAQHQTAAKYTEMFYHTSGQFRFYIQGVGNIQGAAPLNIWTHFVCLRESGVMYMFINGVRQSTTANNTTNLNNTSAKLRIGLRAYDINSPFYGEISLVKTGAGAPSDKQIKKIYDDEKCLFHENAKATLYGSSDAVTALAYDEDTNLLHVGTSAGRSEFQGLCRINNTTTAVTTAISASNDLVAEQ